MKSGRAWRTGLILGLLACAGCDETKEGTLEVHWSINGQEGAAACSAADVSTVRVLTDNEGTEPDSDPSQPTWDYVDLPCADGMGSFVLREGLHRVRLVALDSGGQVRSQAVEYLGVEVVHGSTMSIPRAPDLEPPIDIEVPVCGNGVMESGEWCDATDLGGQDCTSRGFTTGDLACQADCTLDEGDCQ